MTTYRRVCAYNKELYGQLEALTMQIKAYTDADDMAMVLELKNKKGAVRVLIDRNLERLDTVWYTNLKVGRSRRKQRRAQKLKSVISAYELNPCVESIPGIAELYGMPVALVCKTISAHLNNTTN